MGYAGKLEEKLKAQRLRKQGFSYKEILQTISVSKDTISRWCKDIELSAEQKECLLQNKFAGQKKGSIVAAENKRKARLVRIQIITQESLEDLGDLVERDIFPTSSRVFGRPSLRPNRSSSTRRSRSERDCNT